MALRAVLDHPKLNHLQALLKIPRYAAVGILESLWHFTSRFTPQGNIGKYSDSQIEAWLGWETSSPSLMKALVESGWLDAHPDHRLLVHDWDKHCDDATRKQLQRSRLPFAVGTHEPISANSPDSVGTHEPISANSPDSVGTHEPISANSRRVSGLPGPESESESEPTPPFIPPRRGVKDDSVGNFSFKTEQIETAFNELWRIWPHRGNDPKLPAKRKFAQVAKFADLDEILQGARRYAAFQKASGNVDERGKGNVFVPMLKTWLQGHCWTDDYEIVEGAVVPGGVSVQSVVARAAEIQREIERRYGAS